MAAKKLPDQAYLRECFFYNPKTGELFWRLRPREHFRATRWWLHWARMRAYRPAGTPHTHHAGIEIGFEATQEKTRGLKFLAHRIIWKWVTGRDPEAEIDHINNDPFDNRWANLREATRTENNRNTRSKRFKRKPEHQHLPKGAYPHGKKYTSVITANGKQHYLGTFNTAAEAHAAYARASIEWHGEFGNTDHQLCIVKS